MVCAEGVLCVVCAEGELCVPCAEEESFGLEVNAEFRGREGGCSTMLRDRREASDSAAATCVF